MTTNAGAVRPRIATDRELVTRGRAKIKRDEWANLLDEGPDWLAAQDPVDLADRVEAWRRASTPTDGKIPAPRWLWAKSLLLAADASRDEDVAEFRRRHLPDGLVDLVDIETWIRAREDDGDHHAPELDLMPDPVLEYPVGDWTRSLLVGFGGVLAELLDLSIALARRYPWQPAQATAFVLTGATPVCNAIQSTTTTNPHRTTITLEIDPEMSVEDVARAYARSRRAQLGPKPRPISGRTVGLVLAKAIDSQAADHVLYGRWNREHPDDKFESIRAFRQALRDGTRRLLDGPRTRR